MLKENDDLEKKYHAIQSYIHTLMLVNDFYGFCGFLLGYIPVPFNRVVSLQAERSEKAEDDLQSGGVSKSADTRSKRRSDVADAAAAVAGAARGAGGEGEGEEISSSRFKLIRRVRLAMRVSGVRGWAGGGVGGDSSSTTGAPGSGGVRKTSFVRSSDFFRASSGPLFHAFSLVAGW